MSTDIPLMDYYPGRKYREKSTGLEWELRALDLDEDWFRLRSCTQEWLGREVTAREFEAEYGLAEVELDPMSVTPTIPFNAGQLMEIVDTLDAAARDMRELMRVAKYNLRGELCGEVIGKAEHPMLIHEAGIAETERVIALLDSLSLKLTRTRKAMEDNQPL